MPKQPSGRMNRSTGRFILNPIQGPQISREIPRQAALSAEPTVSAPLPVSRNASEEASISTAPSNETIPPDNRQLSAICGQRAPSARASPSNTRSNVAFLSNQSQLPVVMFQGVPYLVCSTPQPTVVYIPHQTQFPQARAPYAEASVSTALSNEESHLEQRQFSALSGQGVPSAQSANATAITEQVVATTREQVPQCLGQDAHSVQTSLPVHDGQFPEGSGRKESSSKAASTTPMQVEGIIPDQQQVPKSSRQEAHFGQTSVSKFPAEDIIPSQQNQSSECSIKTPSSLQDTVEIPPFEWRLPSLRELVRLNFTQVLSLIRSNYLNASGEDIFEAVMRWIEADVFRRKSKLEELLLEVRLIFLQHDFLQNVVGKHPLVKEDARCQEIVKYAMLYRTVSEEDRNRIDWSDTGSRVYEQQFCERRQSFGPGKLIYVFGRRRDQTLRDEVDVNEILVEYCDCQKKMWKSAASMPNCREGFAAAAFQNSIWIVGGRQGDYLSIVDIYDPVTNTWREGPPMTRKRGDPGLVEYNGQLYALGGTNNLIRGSQTSTESLRLPEQVWKVRVSMTTARSRMAVAVSRGRIYVVGGDEKTRESSCATMEYFCSINNIWTSVMPTVPTMADFSDAVVCDDMLYVFTAESDRSCFLYNPFSNPHGTWKRIMMHSRSIKAASAVAVVDRHLYLIERMLQENGIRKISRINIDSGKCEVWASRCRYLAAGAKAVVVSDHRSSDETRAQVVYAAPSHQGQVPDHLSEEAFSTQIIESTTPLEELLSSDQGQVAELPFSWPSGLDCPPSDRNKQKSFFDQLGFSPRVQEELTDYWDKELDASSRLDQIFPPLD